MGREQASQRGAKRSSAHAAQLLDAASKKLTLSMQRGVGAGVGGTGVGAGVGADVGATVGAAVICVHLCVWCGGSSGEDSKKPVLQPHTQSGLSYGE